MRRVVVALDHSVDAPSAADAAVLLAERLGAELSSVFVEDVQLFHLAALPVVRIVRSHPSSDRPPTFDVESLERELRVVARRLQRAAEAAALRARVQATFRAVRGAIGEEIARARAEADLVLVGKGSVETRTQVAGFFGDAPSALLLLGRGERLGPPVVVCADAADLDRLLEAARLVGAPPDPAGVTVLLPTDGERAERASRDAEAAIVARGGRARAVRAAQLADELAALRGRTLVVATGSWPQGPDDLVDLLARVRVPVLLVR